MILALDTSFQTLRTATYPGLSTRIRITKKRSHWPDNHDSTYPAAAADLYRPQLENDLQRPNTRLYPGIAATLSTMAELYERGGRSADFALYIAKIREDYGRRPSLMKALKARGL